MSSCEYAHDDGAYVLGALAPAERAAYERHLADCPACREAVADLAVLPGLLGRLDPAGLDRMAPPPTAGSQLPALLTVAKATRRRERLITRLRYAGVGLVAACLALFLGVGIARVSGEEPGDRGVRLTAMQPVRDSVPVSAEVGLTSTAWGTEISMRCHYAERPGYTRAYTFRLVAYGPDGATEQIGSWLARPGDDVSLTGATRFSAAELTRLELTRSDDTPLLAYNIP